ncbi:hypothetical protein P12x_000191 [Tundrisphaera lichenicola]|uniref:hypothetical protein n=1 Tax=Tundrisphaera lichenicola TaxID=2029860 RepID=UPI003EBEA7BF
MLRINLLLAAAIAASTVGCAICDTCDDFPAPCTGPNCGQNYAMPEGAPEALANPGMMPGSPVMGASTPAYAPTDDSAGPAPVAPPDTPSPEIPPAPTTPVPFSPPTPMEPPAQP